MNVAKWLGISLFMILCLLPGTLETANIFEPPKTVFVLFDVSGSTKNKCIRERYLEDFKLILDKMKPGDVIVADRIAEFSGAGSTLPIKHEYKKWWLRNDLIEKVENKKCLVGAEKMLNDPKMVEYTDILSSLHIAERVFKGYRRQRNILVIMSDMIEDSRRYNFEKERLDNERIAEIIAAEKKAGRLPDLTNVKVFAVKNATSQSSDKYIGIKHFWMEYFKECGASLDNVNYGPLVNFP